MNSVLGLEELTMKKILLIAGLAAAALACAAVISVGAFGRGQVTNAAGKRASFQFEAKKTTDGTRVVFAGRGVFETRIERNGVVGFLTILCGEVKGVGKNGNACVIEGLGRLSTTFGTVTTHHPGRVRIAVQDLRTPTGATNVRDKYHIRFVAANAAGPTFEFGGLVTDGDLVVFERNGP